MEDIKKEIIELIEKCESKYWLEVILTYIKGIMKHLR